MLIVIKTYIIEFLYTACYLTLLSNLTKLSNNLYYKLFNDKCINQLMYTESQSISFEFSKTYLLFKTHKEKRENGTYIGRPIISNFSSPLKYLDRYVEFLCSPLLKFIPSKIKNNLDLLEKLKTINNFENLNFCSYDVISMYPSIPHYEASLAVKNMYTDKFDYLKMYFKLTFNLNIPNPNFLQMLLLTILRNSIFKFNDILYKSIKGIPMGSNISVLIADIFVYSYIEYNLNLQSFGIFLYGRFIDDIFLCTQNSFSPENFIIHLEKCSNLKFTFTNPSKNINFLDLNLLINEQSLITKLYEKPSNSHMYLHFKSNHPNYIKRGIIISLLKKYKNICSNVENFNIAKSSLYFHLLNRSYPQSFLLPIFNDFTYVVSKTNIANYNHLKGIPLILPFNNVINNHLRYLIENFCKTLNSAFSNLLGWESLKPILIYSCPLTLSTILLKNRRQL